MLRPRNEVRRLKVAPRKAKPFAEIKSGVLTISKIKNFFSGLQRSEEAHGPPAGKRSAWNGNQLDFILLIHKKIRILK
ncbi:hypothetical protein B4U37_18245 [Sutcliffiella horikoshii]|uniref:Uncharacterized protein n=1 Tax=Sutcliffiella horikoshii TaxID=79883 RepID=A0ABM6KN61_9BACI|nr:hypothetical protein B4U37_18245 [Sutcliffiella horikoshii]